MFCYVLKKQTTFFCFHTIDLLQALIQDLLQYFITLSTQSADKNIYNTILQSKNTLSYGIAVYKVNTLAYNSTVYSAVILQKC